jgi:hypothetical protein
MTEKVDPRGLTIQEETRIVALLARGDTHAQIQEQMAREFRGVHMRTIAAVKKRNKENFDIIRARLLEKQEHDASALKEKANKMISKKLDIEDKKLEIIQRAREDYLNGAISLKELTEILKRHRETTLTELVSVSKEMHNQSSEDPDSKPDAQKDLSDLVNAIRSGDEVKLQQIIFNSKDQEDA